MSIVMYIILVVNLSHLERGTQTRSHLHQIGPWAHGWDFSPWLQTDVGSVITGEMSLACIRTVTEKASPYSSSTVSASVSVSRFLSSLSFCLASLGNGLKPVIEINSLLPRLLLQIVLIKAAGSKLKFIGQWHPFLNPNNCLTHVL